LVGLLLAEILNNTASVRKGPLCLCVCIQIGFILLKPIEPDKSEGAVRADKTQGKQCQGEILRYTSHHPSLLYAVLPNCLTAIIFPPHISHRRISQSSASVPVMWPVKYHKRPSNHLRFIHQHNAKKRSSQFDICKDALVAKLKQNKLLFLVFISSLLKF